mmetsp:Transcript_39674/g.35415  ORF Transcript_39674/g.35415 Transcript_39674/m.35415 type:complete len:105 (+) Transcript_39674:105-419(+)
MSESSSQPTEIKFNLGIQYSRVVELSSNKRKPLINKPKCYKYKTLNIELDEQSSPLKINPKFKYTESTQTKQEPKEHPLVKPRTQSEVIYMSDDSSVSEEESVP